MTIDDPGLMEAMDAQENTCVTYDDVISNTYRSESQLLTLDLNDELVDSSNKIQLAVSVSLIW